MRIAIRYARDGAAKYISHLDMQRAFGRAIRRARIPALYSQGFNPHLVMSFASPLSVGYGTKSDYLELQVADDTDVEKIRKSLMVSCPPGIHIVDVYRMPEGSKKLMALNDSASYEISFSCDGAFLVAPVETLKKEKIHVCQDRKGKAVDLIPLIYDMTLNENKVVVRLANSSVQSLNPATLANELLRMAGAAADFEICRMECYGRDGEYVRPFSSMFAKS